LSIKMTNLAELEVFEFSISTKSNSLVEHIVLIKEVTFSKLAFSKKIPSNKRSGTSPLQKTLIILR